MEKCYESTAQTRQNLIDAFWKLFKQKRVGQISVRELTDIAGYNRSTFYEYFTSIYDLLEHVEDSLVDYFAEFQKKNHGEISFSDLILDLTNFYEEKGEYIAILLNNSMDSGFSHKMKKILREDIRQNWNLDEYSVYTEYIFEYLISSSIALITHWYNSGQDLSPAELTTMLHSLLVNGTLLEQN